MTDDHPRTRRLTPPLPPTQSDRFTTPRHPDPLPPIRVTSFVRTVQNGQFTKPLPLPDGTRVRVEVAE